MAVMNFPRQQKSEQMRTRISHSGTWMLYLVAALVFYAVPLQSWAHVTESHSTQTYEVILTPGTSLLQAINIAAKIYPDVRRYHGHTLSDVHWRFQWDVLPSGMCAITSVHTTLKTTITLPRLLKWPGADRTEFDTYLAALTRHEEGHKQLWKNAANQIDQAIIQLGPRLSCDSLELDANRLGQSILDRTRAAEIEYDLSTNHGCTQGACLQR